MENNKKKSTLFTTTVNTKTLEEFKALCKKKGIPMSVILSALMDGYITEDLRRKEAKKNTKKENKEVIA